MKAEDLFLAIGGLESCRLQRSEVCVNTPSCNTNGEEPKMQHKNWKRTIRNLLIAAAIISALSITAYAAVNARIRLEVTKRQGNEAAEQVSEGTYEVELDFQRTGDAYIEMGAYYPQEIPEGYQLSFVSDPAMGMQNLVYENAAGEEAFRFIMQLGSDGGQVNLDHIKKEEQVTIHGCPGTLYCHERGTQTVVWQDEAQGFGFVLLGNEPGLDMLSIAESVGPGEPLTPTLAAGYDTALSQLGDYRITALPDGFRQTDFMASPLEDGGGWYAYVRRWYGDKVSTDNTIYFAYEHFTLESDPSVENAPETIIEYWGGGEPTTILGMPGAVQDGGIIWVDWDEQVVFSLCASNRTSQELLALAESIERFN